MVSLEHVLQSPDLCIVRNQRIVVTIAGVHRIVVCEVKCANDWAREGIVEIEGRQASVCQHYPSEYPASYDWFVDGWL